MTESTLPDYAVPAQADPLTGRRVFFSLIVLASMAGLIWLLSFVGLASELNRTPAESICRAARGD